jgi:superfamily I DNA and/or RNA helicase
VTVTDVLDRFQVLMDLLDMERQAEKEENKRQLDRWPVEMREQQGKTVTRLTVEKQDVGVGGLPLLVVSRPSAGEELAPFHAMDAGDLVRVVFFDGRDPLEGTLYEVDDYRAVVALNEPLLETPTGRCEVDLLGSDATYKRMRRGLSIARDAAGRLAELRDVLLGLAEARMGKARPVEFLNPNLNRWQQDAVKSALAAEDVAVVHGPPGTGKTTVLVEIIRQAVDRGQKVLASAPSNVAVDNMLEKLLAAGVKAVRLGHPARTLEDLRHATLLARLDEDPEIVEVQERDLERERISLKLLRARQYGGMNADEQKTLKKEARRLWKEAREIEREISKRIVQASDVVLATHGGLGKVVSNVVFDLGVLDEASQSTEPLSWIPIVHSRKVVLAGDPLQLPPTIYSKEAAEKGLALTMMERLMPDLPDAAKTLLRVQYRMHEVIMGFSSERFYDGKLEAHASVAAHTADELQGVIATPLTQRPLTFVDTADTGFTEVWNELLDSRENEGEARVILKVWEDLAAAGIAPRQAAVITPYNAQAKLLKTMAPRGLEISSVDGFQGREKEVILVSLVRSNETGEVGFLSDTRRMNVALTRARRCLVVVGDSATLGRHSFYEAFLEYVRAHGEHTSAWEWLRG